MVWQKAYHGLVHHPSGTDSPQTGSHQGWFEGQSETGMHCVLQWAYGGVDQNDQKCVYYSYQHKTRKWYHKYYRHLREKSMVIAYILYMKDSMEN